LTEEYSLKEELPEDLKTLLVAGRGEPRQLAMRAAISHFSHQSSGAKVILEVKSTLSQFG
jgi:hypothetical protein